MIRAYTYIPMHGNFPGLVPMHQWGPNGNNPAGEVDQDVRDAVAFFKTQPKDGAVWYATLPLPQDDRGAIDILQHGYDLEAVRPKLRSWLKGIKAAGIRFDAVFLDSEGDGRLSSIVDSPELFAAILTIPQLRMTLPVSLLTARPPLNKPQKNDLGLWIQNFYADQLGTLICGAIAEVFHDFPPGGILNYDECRAPTFQLWDQNDWRIGGPAVSIWSCPDNYAGWIGARHLAGTETQPLQQRLCIAYWRSGIDAINRVRACAATGNTSITINPPRTWDRGAMNAPPALQWYTLEIVKHALQTGIAGPDANVRLYYWNRTDDFDGQPDANNADNQALSDLIARANKNSTRFRRSLPEIPFSATRLQTGTETTDFAEFEKRWKAAPPVI